MGFHLRKSIKCGPFRFNLSGSGIGISTGVKGLNFGIDGKGKSYISGGKGVLRYRKYITSQTKGIKEMANDNIFKPKLSNSYKAKGFLGLIVCFFLALVCIPISLILLCVCWTLAGVFFEKHPWWGVLFFIVGLGLTPLPWEYIYKPKFMKIARNAEKMFLQKDYEKALELFQEAHTLSYNSKIYETTYNFDKYINDYIYKCYIILEKYADALRFLENRSIISSRRERMLKMLHKLHKWEQIVNFMQKEYTQEEKDEHPSFYGVLAEAFLNLNQPQVAVDCLLQGPANTRKMSDEMCAFRYALGECYEALGDIENAEKQYNKIYAYDMSYRDVSIKIKH